MPPAAVTVFPHVGKPSAFRLLGAALLFVSLNFTLPCPSGAVFTPGASFSIFLGPDKLGHFRKTLALRMKKKVISFPFRSWRNCLCPSAPSTRP